MFDHVGIAVADLAASERFYRTVLSALGVEPSYAGWSSGRYRVWHPLDHVSARYLRRAPDGLVGPGAQIALCEVLARDARFTIDVVSMSSEASPATALRAIPAAEATLVGQRC